MKTKLFIFVSLAVTILSAVILRFYEPKPTKEIKTPMGHEMEYIRHMDEFLYEYRDTYTGIHYIVSIVGDNATVYRPVFQSENMDLIVTK